MRISDWSSDVCSSDLVLMPLGQFGAGGAGKQPQHEFRGLLRGQVAGVVQAHKFVVAPPRLFRIASAPGAGKEIGPLIVAVHREQRVVQVEKGKPLEIGGGSCRERGCPAGENWGGG